MVVAANITGSGSITNIGPGMVVLTGTNTYTGNTVIPNGTIQTGIHGALPAATGLIWTTAFHPTLSARWT